MRTAGTCSSARPAREVSPHPAAGDRTAAIEHNAGTAAAVRRVSARVQRAATSRGAAAACSSCRLRRLVTTLSEPHPRAGVPLLVRSAHAQELGPCDFPQLAVLHQLGAVRRASRLRRGRGGLLRGVFSQRATRPHPHCAPRTRACCRLRSVTYVSGLSVTHVSGCAPVEPRPSLEAEFAREQATPVHTWCKIRPKLGQGRDAPPSRV